jgi:hypothetical protein
MGFFGTNAALGKIDRDISAIAEGKPTYRTRSAPGGNDVTGVFPATSHAFSAGCAA